MILAQSENSQFAKYSLKYACDVNYAQNFY